MTGAGPYRRPLWLTGAQALLVVATLVAVPVSAAPPTDRAVGHPPPARAAEAPAPVQGPVQAAVFAASIPPAAVAPAPVPASPESAAPEPPPVAAPAPAVIRRAASPRAVSPTPRAAKPAPPSTASSQPEGGTVIRIGAWSATVERGDQAVIDRCRATLFWGPWPEERPGTVWLAGHDHCGFGFWADLPLGTTVTFAGPHGAVSYVVISHTWVPRKGGSSVGLIHDDLILQTCHGQGTSLTYATRRP